MDETYASGIERGRRNPSWEKLLALANVLDVPLSKIILESEQEAEDEQGSGPQP
jgi:transcriptional regulator with XRE-family HTH domain